MRRNNDVLVLGHCRTVQVSAIRLENIHTVEDCRKAKHDLDVLIFMIERQVEQYLADHEDGLETDRQWFVGARTDLRSSRMKLQQVQEREASLSREAKARRQESIASQFMDEAKRILTRDEFQEILGAVKANNPEWFREKVSAE